MSREGLDAEVWLYQYDISGGLAAWAAPVTLFESVEGIWHTSIVVFGKEYWPHRLVISHNSFSIFSSRPL